MPRLQDIYQALHSQQIVISTFLFSLQFITIHYIFLDWFSSKSLNFSKIRGSWAPSSEDSTKNMPESGQEMAKFESRLRVRTLAGNATA